MEVVSIDPVMAAPSGKEIPPTPDSTPAITCTSWADATQLGSHGSPPITQASTTCSNFSKGLFWLPGSAVPAEPPRGTLAKRPGPAQRHKPRLLPPFKQPIPVPRQNARKPGTARCFTQHPTFFLFFEGREQTGALFSGAWCENTPKNTYSTPCWCFLKRYNNGVLLEVISPNPSVKDWRLIMVGGWWCFLCKIDPNHLWMES